MFGDSIMTSFEICGSTELVLSFLIISRASNDDLPHTPQDEFVKKFRLILSISILSELLIVILILFLRPCCSEGFPKVSIFSM